MPDLKNHWFIERLAYLGWSLLKDTGWRRKASDTFPRLQSDPKAEGQCKLRGEAPFVSECHKALRNLPGSSDLSRPWKELYRKLVVGSTLDPLMDRLSWLIEEVHSHWNWVPGSGFLNNSKCSLTWQLAWNVLHLFGLNYKVGLADMPDCPCCDRSSEEMAEHTYYCEWVCPFWNHIREWTACIEPKQLILLNIGYVRSFASVSRWEACGVSRDPSCS